MQLTLTDTMTLTNESHKSKWGFAVLDLAGADDHLAAADFIGFPPQCVGAMVADWMRSNPAAVAAWTEPQKAFARSFFSGVEHAIEVPVMS